MIVGGMAELTEDALRAEVRDWVKSHWDPSLSLRAWRELLVEAGWAVPSWPERWYGRGLPAWSDEVVRSEIQDCHAVAATATGPASLAAPTILEQGPDHMRERFLRPLLTGEEVWCQLFSEPSAGSDLAGLTTTAVLDGDEWVVNGQKVWNTSAHHADFGMLVARTDWDVPKHQGITYLVLPMKQPGVEVRPLKQMNYHASFNEVFMTDARIPKDWVVGEVGKGWNAALATLAHERRFSLFASIDVFDGVDPGPVLDQAREEAAELAKVYSWYPQRAGRADLVIEHARARGVEKDPLLRQEIGRVIAMYRASQWTAERARAARAIGRPPGPEGSIGKLALSNVARQAHRVHALIAGAGGMLAGDEGSDALHAIVAEILISVPGQSIAGGSDEIQKNIIGERFLGLPKEPDPAKGRPYREVRNR
ncbi:MAG TPA: acyl-CoA dehydrogenase family protein [Acidimicrobiales bacterium]|nr:acyl-CoA dehydrogenase family protein [Acidimicrobiales bacterium]